VVLDNVAEMKSWFDDKNSSPWAQYSDGRNPDSMKKQAARLFAKTGRIVLLQRRITEGEPMVLLMKKV